METLFFYLFRFLFLPILAFPRYLRISEKPSRVWIRDDFEKPLACFLLTLSWGSENFLLTPKRCFWNWLSKTCKGIVLEKFFHGSSAMLRKKERNVQMKHAFEMGCNPMWKKVQREVLECMLHLMNLNCCLWKRL